MSTMTRRELENLAKIQAGICASFYVPVGLARDAKQAAAIRLKNQLRECEGALTSTGMRAADVQNLLAPVVMLAETKLQNVAACHGLAALVTSDNCRIEPLAVDVEEIAWVGPRFYIRPLIAQVHRDHSFCVLAISQNSARLFRGSLHGLSEEHVPNMPGALQEVIDTSSRDGTMQAHTAQHGGSVKQDAAFHGQGGLSDHHKGNIMTYFHEVDRALEAHLHGDPAPLLFAGVDYLYPLFARVTHHPHLLAEHIAENPDRLTSEELFQRAITLLEPTWHRERNEALRTFGNRLGTYDVSDEVHLIVPAAAAGQVKSLLVRQSGPLWGRFDAARGETHLDHEHLPGSEDLLDRACAEVLLHGGEVYAVPWNQISTGAPMAAVFHYAISPLPAAASPN